MTTDHTTPPVAIGPRGYHVDHRGQPVDGFDWKYGPPRDNLMPPSDYDDSSDHAVDAMRYMIGPDGKVRPELAPQPTARDLARFVPPWWMVLVVILVLAFVALRAWQAWGGGR